MYLCDVHTHTLISHDSRAPLEKQAEAAAAAGLSELCVTDHCDLLNSRGQPVTFFDWPAAKEQYRRVKAAFAGRLELRLGLELGSAPLDPAAARSILAEGGGELDFVLGSLHNWIGEEGGIDLFYTRFAGDPDLCRRAVENVLTHTWTLVTRLPDCYDSLAHISYPLRYIRRDGMDLSLWEFEDRVRPILTEVARTDHALEVNTHHGLDLADWPRILNWFRECGGKLVTVGSDAHKPADIARGVPEALELIKAAGFERITTFQGRKPITHRL